MQIENKVGFSNVERNAEGYEMLVKQIGALLEGENDLIANLANVSAVLMDFGSFHWVGFYLVKDGELVLGPFQGPVACSRIARGKGVCGTAWAEDKSLVVNDVHQFPGHIACSAFSNSELVIPIHREGRVVGVLDIDSTEFSDFSAADQNGMEAIVQVLEKHL